MNKKILFSGVSIFLFMAFFSITAIAQNQKKVEFKYVEQLKDSPSKVIVFAIVGNTGEVASKDIVKSLLGIGYVSEVKIFYNRRVKMLVSEVPDAILVRNLLLAQGFDFDLSYVVVSDKLIHSEMLDKKSSYPVAYTPKPIYDYSYPESFPVFKNTGNPAADKENFAKAKQQWIEDHSEEWKSMTGIEYLDYSVILNK